MTRQHLLEIGFSVIDGAYSNSETENKIKEVVRDGLFGLDTENLLVRCALLFATVDWCQEKIPGSIRDELEAQLGHLGKRWLSHRGMKRERWKDFLKWFVYFYNQDKLSQKKTKRD